MGIIWVILMILWTTFRHEGSHALATLLTGGQVSAMRLLPGYDADLGFYFGYVIRDGGVDWMIISGPFIASISVALVAYMAIKTLKPAGWVRNGLIWLGIVSPLADLIYNYQGGFWRATTDVARLYEIINPLPIHLFFIFSILFCIFGLRAVQLTR